MKTKIRKLLQIGIIVESVDEAVRNYEMILGTGPWEIKTVSGEDEPFRDLQIDGVSRPEKICKLAICKVFGMEIELIEPIAESPYSRWLVEHGPGLHHIAVDTEDDYDGILQSYQKEKGEKPWIRATGMNGLMDYSYLDFRKEMGLIMECYRNIEPGRTGIDPDYKGELV